MFVQYKWTASHFSFPIQNKQNGWIIRFYLISLRKYMWKYVMEFFFFCVDWVRSLLFSDGMAVKTSFQYTFCSYFGLSDLIEMKPRPDGMDGGTFFSGFASFCVCVGEKAAWFFFFSFLVSYFLFGFIHFQCYFLFRPTVSMGTMLLFWHKT